MHDVLKGISMRVLALSAMIVAVGFLSAPAQAGHGGAHAHAHAHGTLHGGVHLMQEGVSGRDWHRPQNEASSHAEAVAPKDH